MSHRDSCDETVLVWGNTGPFKIEQRLEQPESLNHLVQLDPQIYPGQLTSLEHNSQATNSNCRGRIDSPSRSPCSHLIKFGATLAKTNPLPSVLQNNTTHSHCTAAAGLLPSPIAVPVSPETSYHISEAPIVPVTDPSIGHPATVLLTAPLRFRLQWQISLRSK